MIRFKNVSKEFQPKLYGVADLNFEITPGEFVLITGPSGSGKTTIMRLLTKEYTPSEGEIHFEDELVNKIKNSKIHLHRRKIGVVFQNYLLLPELNVWENIALPLSIVGKKQSEIEERVTDLLQLVALEEKAAHFPSELSGGEAQRISIARALATGPSVLFADEPTGNLDPSTSLSISKLLKQINELGTTVIFSTHDPVVIKSHAEDRHIILDKGQIIKDTAAKSQDKAETTKAKVDVEDLAEEKKKDDEETQDFASQQKSDKKSKDAINRVSTEPTPSRFSFFSFFSNKSKPRTIVLSEDLDEESDKESEIKSKGEEENKKEKPKKKKTTNVKDKKDVKKAKVEKESVKKKKKGK